MRVRVGPSRRADTGAMAGRTAGPIEKERDGGRAPKREGGTENERVRGRQRGRKGGGERGGGGPGGGLRVPGFARFSRRRRRRRAAERIVAGPAWAAARRRGVIFARRAPATLFEGRAPATGAPAASVTHSRGLRRLVRVILVRNTTLRGAAQGFSASVHKMALPGPMPTATGSACTLCIVLIKQLNRFTALVPDSDCMRLKIFKLVAAMK